MFSISPSTFYCGRWRAARPPEPPEWTVLRRSGLTNPPASRRIKRPGQNPSWTHSPAQPARHGGGGNTAAAGQWHKQELSPPSLFQLALAWHPGQNRQHGTGGGQKSKREVKNARQRRRKHHAMNCCRPSGSRPERPISHVPRHSFRNKIKKIQELHTPPSSAAAAGAGAGAGRFDWGLHKQKNMTIRRR